MQRKFFFEPIVGNGKHWELGVGFTGHVITWEKGIDQNLSVYTDLNITYMFSARQRRSFDFKKNGFGSRYLLLKEFDSNGIFTGKVIPAINKTTLECKVRNDIQVDFVFMFGYTYKGIVFDIGYNGWIRSKEKISLQGCIEEKRFGIKGIQDVFNRTINQPDMLTQSTATFMGNNLSEQDMVADDPSPLFITTEDIDVKSAASPRVMTHKIFFHLGHIWEKWNGSPKTSPFIGAGFEIEFEGINERNTSQTDKTTMGQWGVWFKGGLTY